MQYDATNVFAKIIREEIKVNKIYEDELVLAFHDAHPIAETHFLVIPKKPYTCYSDFIQKANPEEISSFFITIDYIAKQVLGNSANYKLVTNNGKMVGQTVFHFHCHILSGQTDLKKFAMV